MKADSFSKWVVKVLLIWGIVWINLSYILAWFGRPVNENLSITICKVVIATVLTYYIKAGVENVSKHTDWPRPNKRGGEVCGPDQIPTGEAST